MTPRTVAARSAWVSGGWGLAEYVISSSPWRASPTRSASTAAVARTGTWWEAGPLYTLAYDFGCVQGLAEAVQRRFGVHFRPKDINDLLAVQRVHRIGREQLGQRLRTTPRPVRLGLLIAAPLHAEPAKQAYPDQ